ncbi:Uncharacterised protein [Mycobacteroides abscessus]|nr:Uncharacterised protein [Mycobacteroides abscessus]
MKSSSTPGSRGSTGSSKDGKPTVEACRSSVTLPWSAEITASAPGIPPPARSSALFSARTR